MSHAMKCGRIRSACQVPTGMHGIHFVFKPAHTGSRCSVTCAGVPMESHVSGTTASRDGSQRCFPKSQVWPAREHGLIVRVSCPTIRRAHHLQSLVALRRSSTVQEVVLPLRKWLYRQPLRDGCCMQPALCTAWMHACMKGTQFDARGHLVLSGYSHVVAKRVALVQVAVPAKIAVAGNSKWSCC